MLTRLAAKRSLAQGYWGVLALADAARAKPFGSTCPSLDASFAFPGTNVACFRVPMVHRFLSLGREFIVGVCDRAGALAMLTPAQ